MMRINPRSIMLSVMMVSTAFAGQTLYVDMDAPGPTHDGSSWVYAYLYLQDAIAAASSGDEIRVAEGIYKPDQGGGKTPGDRNATFQLKNGVVMKGGYAGFGQPDPDARGIDTYETILSGDLTGDDGPNFADNDENSYHVVTGSSTDETAVLDGFTITGGNANGGSGWDSPYGGGMYNDSGNPTLTNCTFIGNSARSNGGGMNNISSSPTVTCCKFIGNSSSLSRGGGMYNNSSNPTMTNCTFIGNSVRSNGGGMYNKYSNPTLINCTFSSNSAGRDSGGIYCEESDPTITNCILWGNGDRGGTDESAQIRNDNTSSPIVNYGCIQGWTDTWGGIGNISGDPLFVDIDGIDNTFGTKDDNLRLSGGSPCIDAADNTAVLPLVLTDLDGDARFVDDPCTPDTGVGTPPIVDMGAYEGPKEIFLFSTKLVIVTEGQTKTFTVALEKDPCGIVEVAVAHGHGDPDIIVESGASLNFDSTNYYAPQTITLAAAEDSDNYNGTAVILVSAPGLGTIGVDAVEVDNEPNPNLLFVDTNASGANNGANWGDAFTDLQEALNIVTTYPQFEEVHVAQGVYMPTGPSGGREATFKLFNGVAIMGGYAGFGEPDPNARDIIAYVTILSGDLYNNDGEVSDPCHLPNDPNRAENSYHVVTGNGTDETAVLDGFTISGGNANSSSNQNSDMFGGGMSNEDGSPTLIDCKFKNNLAEWYGGGMSNSGVYSTPRLTNCIFIGNYAGRCGGGLINNIGSPILINCIFTGNSVNEAGGGMFESQGGSTLTGCTFNSNSAFWGGGMSNVFQLFNHPTLTNCLFIGNSATERGGAMDNYIAVVVMNNCTFAENSAPNGKAISCSSYPFEPWTYLEANNCIFWDGGNEVWDGGLSIIEITYSNVQGGWPGDGNNIDSDPLFADAVNGDYHLQSQRGRWDTNQNTWVIDSNVSPCIDTGNPNSDWTAELWPHGKCINIGAYGGTPEASMSLSNAGNIADLNTDGFVDYADMMLFTNKWVYQKVLLSEDLDRNGFVNSKDFAIFANEWFWKE